MLEVELGGAADQLAHRVGGAGRQRVGVRLQPGEELRVADQRHLDRLGHAGDRVPAPEALEEPAVVQHGERRGEGAEEVLHAERVDAVLHADARVGLREHRGREPHRPDPAVRRRGGVARGIEQRAAAHDDHEGLAVQPERVQHGLEGRQRGRIVLHRLAALDDPRRDATSSSRSAWRSA